MTEEIVVQIQGGAGGYTARLGHGRHRSFELDLRHELKIPAIDNGGKKSLQDLLDDLHAFDRNKSVSAMSDARGSALGKYLAALLWGGDSGVSEHPSFEGVLADPFGPKVSHVVIETDDPVAAALPWALTEPPDRGQLYSDRIAVSVRIPSCDLTPDVFGLPPEGPKILLVFPDAQKDLSADHALHHMDLCERLAPKPAELSDVLATEIQALERRFKELNAQVFKQIMSSEPPSAKIKQEMRDTLSDWRALRCAPDDRLSASLVNDTVTTWAELRARLETDPPDILYYLGHGVVDSDGALSLQFEAPNGQVENVKASKFANFLRDASEADSARSALQLVYLNCCWGGATTGEGGPMQIGAITPAFISNRIAAYAPVAQLQALEIFDEIIHRDAPPHEAVMNVLTRGASSSSGLTGDGTEEDEPWWLSPVAVANYTTWRPRIPGPRQKDLNAVRLTDTQTLRLNREMQVEPACVKVEELSERVEGRRALILAWTGTQDQGIHSLADRLWYEILEQEGSRLRRLSKFHLDWGTALLGNTDIRKSIGDVLGATYLGAGSNITFDFKTDADSDGVSVQNLAARMERSAGREGGLLLIRHAPMKFPLKRRNAPDPKHVGAVLMSYAKLLSDLGKHLEKKNVFPVVFAPIHGVDRAALSDELEERPRDEVPTLVLTELASIERRDLIRFFAKQDSWLKKEYKFKSSEIDELPQQILDQTGGVYEPTRRLLLDPPDTWTKT